jgi:hypothetical protein
MFIEWPMNISGYSTTVINSAESPPTSLPDVTRWRERWFMGPASGALYTIEEDDEECSSTEDEERPSEPETLYTIVILGCVIFLTLFF